MKKIFAGLLIAGMLAGCSSTPTKEQEGAAVEDLKPLASTPAPAAAQAPKPDSATGRPLGTSTVAASPLKDPANILSKRSVYFDYDSNLVKDEYKPLITAHARYLTQNRAAQMRVEGNADDRGSREYNLALGQRRAEAVKQMLQLLGAQASQIESVSFGEEKPKATGQDEASWAENRRADIRYQSE
ncbi:MAG: peptidoglycan-associated lipoprotein Pal [Burkholderiales bacterium]|nr:peptidoglycan-associated lipoprotein Pal [Burkholderiales bacterium]